jgi:hypothetical protein
MTNKEHDFHIEGNDLNVFMKVLAKLLAQHVRFSYPLDRPLRTALDAIERARRNPRGFDEEVVVPEVEHRAPEPTPLPRDGPVTPILDEDDLAWWISRGGKEKPSAGDELTGPLGIVVFLNVLVCDPTRLVITSDPNELIRLITGRRGLFSHDWRRNPTMQLHKDDIVRPRDFKELPLLRSAVKNLSPRGYFLTSIEALDTLFRLVKNKEDALLGLPANPTFGVGEEEPTPSNGSHTTGGGGAKRGRSSDSSEYNSDSADHPTAKKQRITREESSNCTTHEERRNI